MSTSLDRSPSRSILLPALTALVAGVLIGAVAVLVFGERSGLRPVATAPVTVTVTAEPPPPPPGTSRVTVDIPDECLDVARRGAGVAGKINEAVEAARLLQLDRARRLLEEVQQDNPGELVVTADRCRSAFEALTASPPPTPGPAPR